MSPDLHEAYMRQREIDRAREEEQLRMILAKKQMAALSKPVKLVCAQPAYDGPWECEHC